MEHNIQYFALGDSLTEGYGAPPNQGFVDHYQTLTKQFLGKPVTCFNAGRKGETTQEIVTRLKNETALQQQLKRANIITITAGGNDLLQAAKQFLFCREPQILKAALKGCQMQYDQLLETVKAINQTDSGAIVRLLGLYNPFPHVEEAEFWVRHFNKMLKGFETRAIQVVHIYEAFESRIESLLYQDHVHPNEAGYKLMAEETAATGYRGLG
jgi:lysophospholipase L1-like esterase